MELYYLPIPTAAVGTLELGAIIAFPLDKEVIIYGCIVDFDKIHKKVTYRALYLMDKGTRELMFSNISGGSLLPETVVYLINGNVIPS